MLTSEYAVYMDTQQAVNLELLRRFREAGVEFALASCASTANSRPLRSRGAGGRDTVPLFVAAREAGVRLSLGSVVPFPVFVCTMSWLPLLGAPRHDGEFTCDDALPDVSGPPRPSRRAGGPGRTARRLPAAR